MTEQTRKEVRQTFGKILKTVDVDTKRITFEELNQILYTVKKLAEHEYHYRLYSNQD